MNRTEARALWQRVAAGDLEDPQLVAWLRQRAAAIVEADDLPSGQRPDALVRAAALHGPEDKHANVREKVELLLEFDFIEDGKPRPPKRGENMRSMVAAARSAAPGWANLTDDEVRKRLERMFARKR